MLYPLSYERWCPDSLRHPEPRLGRPGSGGGRYRGRDHPEHYGLGGMYRSNQSMVRVSKSITAG
jgi:hypothetical protein